MNLSSLVSHVKWHITYDKDKKGTEHYRGTNKAPLTDIIHMALENIFCQLRVSYIF